MAALDMKRHRQDSLMKARKRRKDEPSKSPSYARSREVTAVNTLPWTEAALPDRLDDAEGFFGLEEISDVEVIRDEKHGRVEYRVGEEPPVKMFFVDLQLIPRSIASPKTTPPPVNVMALRRTVGTDSTTQHPLPIRIYPD